jgi:hypothetical protein
MSALLTKGYLCFSRCQIGSYIPEHTSTLRCRFSPIGDILIFYALLEAATVAILCGHKKFI